MGGSLASWLSEQISDCERMWRDAREVGDYDLMRNCQGQVEAFLEVEEFIANQEKSE